jgi:hypothetical protein
MSENPQAPGMSRRRPPALLIGLASLVVIVALCLGCGRPLVNHAKKAQEPPVRGPATSSDVTVVEPETLAGRPRITDEETDQNVELIKTAVRFSTGADSSVGGLYGHEGADDTVLMTASAGAIDDPKLAVDSLYNDLGLTWKSGGKTVSPGSRGGAAKCRDAGDSNRQLAVCVWADSDTIGVVVWYDRTANAIKADFGTARSEIETTP